jgi:hypothetical protein
MPYFWTSYVIVSPMHLFLPSQANTPIVCSSFWSPTIIYSHTKWDAPKTVHHLSFPLIPLALKNILRPLFHVPNPTQPNLTHPTREIRKICGSHLLPSIESVGKNEHREGRPLCLPTWQGKASHPAEFVNWQLLLAGWKQCINDNGHLCYCQKHSFKFPPSLPDVALALPLFSVKTQIRN